MYKVDVQNFSPNNVKCLLDIELNHSVIIVVEYIFCIHKSIKNCINIHFSLKLCVIRCPMNINFFQTTSMSVFSERQRWSRSILFSRDLNLRWVAYIVYVSLSVTAFTETWIFVNIFMHAISFNSELFTSWICLRGSFHLTEIDHRCIL